jgi:WD40 repeat protein
MAGVTAFALSQRSEAREQAREARAHELEALARGAFETDPERGLVFALEAALLSPTPSSEETLRDALQASRVLSFVQFDEPVKAASQFRGAVIGATASGSVVTADSSTDRTREEIETGVEAMRASFSEGGSALLTGADGRLRLVRPNGSVVDVPGVSGSRGAELSTVGNLAVSIDETGTRLIEVDSGMLRQFFDRPGTLSATVSRDGALVATGHAAKVVRMWDVRTGARLRKLFGHVGGVVAVALSPRGDLVASASRDGTARVWRVADGQLVAVLTGHGNALTDIDFSPDGTQVVTASKDRTARVWKVDTGALLIVLRGHRDVVTSAAFGRTGRNVVTASADGTARVWDGVVQPELDVLATLPAPVNEVVAAGDGYRVVAADDRAHVLDPVTGEEHRSEPAGPRTTTVAGPNNATATIRGNTVVVRSDRGTTVLKGHGDRVTSASFSKDGTLLVTASRDREARVWDLATGDSIVLQGHFGPVQDARFSPNARWVVTAGPGRAGLWDARTGALVELLRGHKGRLTSAGFDPTGRVIVTGGEDGTVRTYRCLICGDSDELVKLAERRLAATGRELTSAERER